MCYILSDYTEKQSIIRMAPRQKREEEDRRDGARVGKKWKGKRGRSSRG